MNIFDKDDQDDDDKTRRRRRRKDCTAVKDFVQEVLRLYPPILGCMRQINNKSRCASLGDYELSCQKDDKNARAWGCIQTANVDEKIFSENAKSFEPRRWETYRHKQNQEKRSAKFDNDDACNDNDDDNVYGHDDEINGDDATKCPPFPLTLFNCPVRNMIETILEMFTMKIINHIDHIEFLSPSLSSSSRSLKQPHSSGDELKYFPITRPLHPVSVVLHSALSPPPGS